MLEVVEVEEEGESIVLEVIVEAIVEVVVGAVVILVIVEIAGGAVVERE